MNLTEFHHEVAHAELGFAMNALRDFVQETGVLNWRQTGALDVVANAAGLHPLKTNVQRLAEWIDAYEAGTATRDEWQQAISHSMEMVSAVRGFLFDRQEHDNPLWQQAKICAQVSIDAEASRAAREGAR